MTSDDTKTTPSRVKYNLNLPLELKEQLEELSFGPDVSLNAKIVFILEEYIKDNFVEFNDIFGHPVEIDNASDKDEWKIIKDD